MLKRILQNTLCFVFILFSVEAIAHPLAPSLLEIIEHSSGESEVIWKTPSARVPGENIFPVLPKVCEQQGPVKTSRVEVARIDRWKIICHASWVGSEVGVEGIASSRADVILRLVLADGRKYQKVLTAQDSRFVVPEHPQVLVVFKNYLKLGVEHILTGWDHLLFVLGLVLLVKNRKALLWTITAFTLGHSVTLSLAALGYVHVWSAAVEALIAFSVLVLAIELTRTQTGKGTFFHRYPWAMAFAFGLLHGLGFAGALAEIGLPVGEIPMALFSFNMGIELGQLLFIIVILLLQRGIKFIPYSSVLKKLEIPAYVIGSLSAFWFFERLSKL